MWNSPESPCIKHISNIGYNLAKKHLFTWSFTPFLRPVKVFRAGLASVEWDELCGFSCLQGDTEEMSVDRTIHLRSGAEATAVTVGTKAASASFRIPVFWEGAWKCVHYVLFIAKLHLIQILVVFKKYQMITKAYISNHIFHLDYILGKHAIDYLRILHLSSWCVQQLFCRHLRNTRGFRHHFCQIATGDAGNQINMWLMSTNAILQVFFLYLKKNLDWGYYARRHQPSALLVFIVRQIFMNEICETVPLIRRGDG